MSEEKLLLIISWQYLPFMIRLLMIGTRKEIYAEATAMIDCTYCCEKENFILCVENCYKYDTNETFTDEYHGLLVCTPDTFDHFSDAEDYIKRRFSKYS